MKKPLFILLLFLINASGFGQQLIDKIPIRLIDDLIFIEVFVNDSPDPLNFIFDTGAGITAIDTKIAEQLALKISGKSKIGTSGKSILSEESTQNKLKLGQSLTLDNMTLVLMDLSHLSHYFNYNVDGIIGFDLLSNIITETNIDVSEMRFFSNTNYVFQGLTKPLKLVNLESNHFGLPITIVPKGNKNSISLILKIDTAAGNYLTLHHKTVAEHDLIQSNKRYKTKKGFGADSTITNNLNGRVASAIFGAKTWKNIPAVFEVDPLNMSSERQAYGLIGQKMLLDFNITYHLSDGVVYLEKRK